MIRKAGRFVTLTHRLSFGPLCCLLVFITTISVIRVPAQMRTIGPPGGRVEGIAVDPLRPSTAYASTREGAFFRSTDKGQSCEAMVAYAGGAGNQITVDPQNSEILYTSVFKSTDAGLSWVRMTGGGSSLAINPLNPNTLFATTRETEVTVTRDAGLSWSVLDTLPTSVTRIALSAADTTILYVGGISALYKSTDAGLSWSNVTLSLGAIQVSSIALQRNSSAIVYLGTSDQGIFKSTDGGLSWNKILPLADVNQVLLDPTDSATIYAVSGDEYYWSTPGHVFKSTDAGISWNTMDAGLPDSINCYLSCIAINPQAPEELYCGTYGWGVCRTDNGGVTWKQTNLTTAPVMTIDASGGGTGCLTVGTNDEGILTTTDAGTTWHAIPMGPFPTVEAYFREYCADPNNGQIAYIASLIHGLFQTIDGGASWQLTSMQATFDTYISTVAVHPESSYTVFVGQAGWMSRNLFRSTDRAGSWTNVTPEWSPVGVLQIRFAPEDPSTIMYAAAGDGKGVLKSTDGGRTWSPKTIGLSSADSIAHPVYALAIRREAPNVLYAVQRSSGQGRGSVSRSVDGGETWVSIGSALAATNPLVNGRFVLINPSDPRKVYASLYSDSFGGKGGLFVTADDGRTWQMLYEGAVDPVAINSLTPSVLYIGTPFGIVSVLDTTVTEIREQSPSVICKGFTLYQNYPNPFNASTTLRYALPWAAQVKLTIFDVLGREVESLIDGYMEAGYHETPWDSKRMASGVYYARLAAINEHGKAMFVKVAKLVLMK